MEWPTTWIEPDVFERYLDERVDPALPRAEAIAELAVDDLYLACACVHGIPAALAALDQRYTGNLRAALSTVGRDLVDEALQLLREKLLVPRDGEIKIASYSGHGPLGAWLRVAAIRTALSLRRQRQPDLAADAELDAVLDLAPNAEIRVIAQELGASLRETLQAAVAAQPARTRAILRMYYADQRGVEDIGRVYNVHASSISRWLAKARTEILAHARAALLAKRHSEASLDSLLGHIASLDVSFTSLLR